MRKHLYVDNTDLATFGVYCSGQGTFGAPEKEVTTYTVPGRDGLVLGVNERMENIRVVYPCFIYTNFAENMKNLRSFLLSRSGYVKINDDYDTDHFRMGFFEAGIDPDVTTKNDAGRFNLVFNCQPQRWLNSGEAAIEVAKSSSGVTITNPTQFTSKPLIAMHGYGRVEIRRGAFSDGVIVIILSDVTTDHSLVNQPYYIDCETMNAWGIDGNGVVVNINDDTEFLQSFSSLYGVDAPILKPGNNTVVVTGDGITKAAITPRYWEA